LATSEQKTKKKRVSTRQKSDFAIALKFSKSKFRTCAQT